MLKSLLITAFVVGNGLDALTTYLGLFKLPRNLKGTEMNPVFGDPTKHWRKAMILKGVGTVVIACAMWYVMELFFIVWLDIVVGLVVLNNAFVYITRRFLKRKVMSLGKLISVGCEKAHLPKFVSYVGTVGVLGAVAFGIVMLIK